MGQDEALAYAYFRGETFPWEGEKGWYLIVVDDYAIGWGKAGRRIMKNHYPRGLRRDLSAPSHPENTACFFVRYLLWMIDQNEGSGHIEILHSQAAKLSRLQIGRRQTIG